MLWQRADGEIEISSSDEYHSLEWWEHYARHAFDGVSAEQHPTYVAIVEEKISVDKQNGVS